MHGLYGMTRSKMEPFLSQEAQEYVPALVIVHADKWMDYGTLLDLQDPFLDTPFLFVISRGEKPDSAVAAEFPHRTIIHYYTDEPSDFQVTRLPQP